MIKAVIFDIGKTLTNYPHPLSWTSLYKAALENVADKCGYHLSEEQFEAAIKILKKYNTRENPREYEVSSNTIFTEIINAWETQIEDIEKVKEYFYLFFRQESYIYDDVECTLAKLKKMNILAATLSDVPYGMDNKYALDDIAGIIDYIDFPYTSNDIGYRKPNVKGIELLAEKMNVRMNEILFVGDEEKDILCANNAGVYSVLINREKADRKYGQRLEIYSLTELLEILKNFCFDE